MKIIRITYQQRKDFDADIKCEFCKKETKLNSGYRRYSKKYRNSMLPEMKCGSCNKSTNSERNKNKNT